MPLMSMFLFLLQVTEINKIMIDVLKQLSVNTIFTMLQVLTMYKLNTLMQLRNQDASSCSLSRIPLDFPNVNHVIRTYDSAQASQRQLAEVEVPFPFKKKS